MSETTSKNKKNETVTAKASPVAKVKKQKKGVKESYVSAPVNAVLWILSAVLICGAIFGSYYYANYVLSDE